MEARLGITGPQRLVVRIVGRCPDISAGDLARTLRLHPSTLTGVLKRLEGRRLIVRMRDAHDSRQTRFRLTASGKRVDRLHSVLVEAAVRRTLSSVPERHVRHAAELLTLLERALN